MSIGKREVVLLILSALALVLLWSKLSEDKRQEQTAQQNPQQGNAPGESKTQQSSSELSRPTSAQDQESDTAREMTSEDADAGRNEEFRFKQGQGLSDLLELLRDNAFLDAAALPGNFETPKLEALVKKANNVLAMAVSDAANDRLEAGLYERLPGYSPGVSFTPPKRDNSVLGGIMYTPTGEALQIDLERDEYPEFYAVSDRIGQVERELDARKRDRAK